MACGGLVRDAKCSRIRERSTHQPEVTQGRVEHKTALSALIAAAAVVHVVRTISVGTTRERADDEVESSCRLPPELI